MTYREHVSKEAETQIAEKAIEATGLLLLIKPLLKRAGKLTDAESEMLCETVRKATKILNSAGELYWDDLRQADTTAAVRAAN